jgi:hypothetical protein
MVAFRARDETVDAANLRRLSRPVRCAARDTVRTTCHAFGPWAVGAWLELTDVILTELSGR